MQKITIKDVKEKVNNNSTVIFHASDMLRWFDVLKDPAVLLDIAKRNKERVIPAALAGSTCERCDFFYSGCENPCCAFSRHKLKKSESLCDCGKRCVKKYVQKIEEWYTNLLRAFQEDKEEFFVEATYNLDDIAWQEVYNLEIYNIEAMQKYIHYIIVGRVEKSAAYDTECARIDYENTMEEGKRKIAEAQNKEARFWERWSINQ